MNPDAEMHARWDRIDESDRLRARALRDAIAVEEAKDKPDGKRLRRLRRELDLAEHKGD